MYDEKQPYKTQALALASNQKIKKQRYKEQAMNIKRV